MRQILSISLLVGSAGMVLGSVYCASNSVSGLCHAIASEVLSICSDGETQWMVIGCLLIYCAGFQFLDRHKPHNTTAEIAAKERKERKEEVVERHLAAKAQPTSDLRHLISECLLKIARWGRRAYSGVRVMDAGRVPSRGVRSQFPGTSPVIVPLRSLCSFAANPVSWLWLLIGWSMLRYVLDIKGAASSTEIAVLLAGIAIGKGAALWAIWPQQRKTGSVPYDARQRDIILILVVMLAAGALWHPETTRQFQYRGAERWCGAWDNPNIFGLLMGTGLILALGLAIAIRSKMGRLIPGNRRCRLAVPIVDPIEAPGGGTRPTSLQNRPPAGRVPTPGERGDRAIMRIAGSCWAWVGLCIVAAGLCGLGLVMSFSRGAWLATACGLGALIWCGLHSRMDCDPDRSAELNSAVPQICNLQDVRQEDAPKSSHARQISNLRYSRLQICATSEQNLAHDSSLLRPTATPDGVEGEGGDAPFCIDASRSLKSENQGKDGTAKYAKYANGEEQPASNSSNGWTQRVSYYVNTIRFRFSRVSRVSRLRPASFFLRNWKWLGVVLVSLWVMAFWQFRDTESVLARRMFSVGNVNDFSWRNRVHAWQAAGRMLADRPMLGFGWGQAERVHREQYCTDRDEAAGAIQMNDYLMLGISAGIPALVSLLVFIGLTLRRAFSTASRCSLPSLPVGDEVTRLTISSPTERTEEGGALGTEGSLSLLTSSPTPDLSYWSWICGSAALVLAVGFFFDSGLFRLPTAAVFWILLEMARQWDASAATKEPASETSAAVPGRWDMALRWTAGILVVLCVVQSAVHLVTPRLPVSPATLDIARQWLVPQRERQDFEYLAALPVWNNARLEALLDHAELAGYNRQLVNWQVDEKLYQDYILSPVIALSTINSQPSTDSNWRRPLWEICYPRIRKEESVDSAAAIINRHLRERVTVSGDSGLEDAAEIMRQRVATRAGFQMLCVAALRSTGIPARLSSEGTAEYWSNSKWTPLPAAE